jgi:hypothetical protein
MPMTRVLEINTHIAMFNGLMIIISGYLTQYVNIGRFMIIASVVLIILETILFWILPFASIDEINIVRVLIIIVGIPFSTALRIWLANSTDSWGQEKYLITGIGGSLGIDILGRTLTFWSLSLFNISHHFAFSCAFVIIMGLASIYSIHSGFNNKTS